MTASEELRSLDDWLPQYSNQHEPALWKLRQALPEIVAVVEAAEAEAKRRDQEFYDDAEPEDVPPWQGFGNLHAALAALDEKLGEQC